MLKRGVYAAGMSILNKDLTLNVEATISHAENLIKKGLHGCFFFGSTGMSQLISKNEKMELISKISTHKQRKHFYLGTGCNSLNENIELIKYASEFDFNTILLMPSAYYVGNSDEGVFEFYKKIISECPKIKIVIYNFQKLSGYIFSIDAITKLVKSFPKNIIGVKDSSYNLYENLKIKNLPPTVGTDKITNVVKEHGFKWESTDEIFKKLEEEINELKEAIKSKNDSEIKNEFGDIYFTLLNLSNFLKINPESALQKTNMKFLDRFSIVEEHAGDNIKKQTPKDFKRLWQIAKQKLAGKIPKSK